MTNLITSYDNAAGTGTPVNQVQQTYNDFAQLEKEEQEHDGTVDGSTLAVEYAYADGSANTIRPTGVTYPDGRILTLDYGGGDDDKLSRIATLDWNGTDVSSYTYLGASSIVKETYPQPSVALDYIGTGNTYSGFDRFGRVVDQKWTGASGNLDQFLYGYDRNSNRIYRENVVAGQQATPVHLDELYGYDGINRLTSAHRGQLVNNDRITNHALSQTWQLDATGNWHQFSNYDQATAADVLVQQRTHNEVNEITAISETVGDQWVAPAHDRNGNMTTIPQPADPTDSYTCIYDAWNRLVKLLDGSTTVAEYAYDGQNWRTEKTVSGTTMHFYYSAAWQVLETREAATAPVPATAQFQYVWSLRYIDAPVLRDDRAADPDKVLYYLGDANYNVTSLVDTVGDAVERYIYAPYGGVTIYNADWSAMQSPSLYENPYLYTGRRIDHETQVFYYRARYYVTQLGRFITRDPIGYRDGLNLYQYVRSRPSNAVDPIGSVARPAKRWEYVPDAITVSETIRDPQLPGLRSVFSFVARFKKNAFSGNCCTKVGAVQIAEIRTDWETDYSGIFATSITLVIPAVAFINEWKSDYDWFVDSGVPYMDRSVDPRSQPLPFEDDPGITSTHWGIQKIIRFTQNFEVHVMCLAGPEKGATYGGWTWGHHFRLKEENLGLAIVEYYSSQRRAHRINGSPSAEFKNKVGPYLD